MNFFPPSCWSVCLTLIIIAPLALIALTSQWWLSYDPQATDLSSCPFSPDAQYWLGTDHLGCDVFSRLMAATRVSFGSVMACLLLVLILGLITGGSAGLIGRRAGQATTRVADMFMTFPISILSLSMVGVFGTGLTNVIIAIALLYWARYACVVRSLVISLCQCEFVLASRFSGAGHVRVSIDHLVGAVTLSLLMLATLDISHTILYVAGMPFLGLGVTVPTVKWGVMINDAHQYVWAQSLQMFWPGLVLFISVMAFNLMGDVLRDHLDPHLVTEHAH